MRLVKALFLQALLLFIYLLGLAQNSYTVKVQITGLKEYHPFYLQQFSAGNLVDIDSALPDNNGKATFKIPTASPAGMFRLYLGYNPDSYFPGMPPQTLDFIFNKQQVALRTNFNAPFDSVEIVSTSDNENRGYFEWLKAGKLLNMRIDSVFALNGTAAKPAWILAFNALQQQQMQYEQDVIKKNSNAFFTRIVKARAFPFVDGALSDSARLQAIKANYFTAGMFSDTNLLRTNILEESVIRYLQLYLDSRLTAPQQDEALIVGVDRLLKMAATGDKQVYQYVLNNLVMGFELNRRVALLEHLNQYLGETSCENNLLTPANIKKLKAVEASAIGQRAPDIDAKIINTTPYTVAGVESKYILVLFWASWCEHCQVFVPQIRQELEQYNKGKEKAEQVTVIAVSLDTDEKELRKFLSRQDYSNWLVSCDYKGWNGKTVLDYNIYATPTLYLLNRDKTIIGKPLTIPGLNSYLGN